MNKKGFTLVEIIVVLVILAILASIALPYTLGYIDETKNSKDYLMAGHVLKAAQVMGTKYYELGDYYVEGETKRAYESVSNVVEKPSSSNQRIQEVYNKIVSGNEDFIPFKAIFVIEEGKVQVVRYKNLDRGLVYEWTKDNQKWKIVKKDDPVGNDQWAIDVIQDIHLNDRRIYWNGYHPDNMPYIDNKYKLTS